MSYMFIVRSARALRPSLESGPPRACRLRRHHPAPSRLPARTSPRIACPPFDSAGCDGVQPAAQLRHVPGHDHAPHVLHAVHVLRALRACSGPPSLESGPPRPCRLRRRHPTPSRLPGRTSSCIACPPFDSRQGASVFNQPLSFDTSKVTDMSWMFYVRSARALAPTALSRALPVHAACVAATPNALTPPGPHPFPHRMPAFRLGRARRRSTSRSASQASTRPRSRPWSRCSTCVPRVPCPPQP